MSNYTKKDTCRVCKSAHLRQILDLNDQPLANSYHTGETQQHFPLKLNLCEDHFFANGPSGILEFKIMN